jgi:adenosylhomocysteine nucleosidase
VDAVRSAFPAGIKRHIAGHIIEMYSIDHREYWLIQTGVGLARAQDCAARVFTAQSFNLAVSTGFACALVAAHIGDLLVSRQVMYLNGVGAQLSDKLEVSGPEREVVLALAEGLVPPEHSGTFVSTDHIVGRASDKAWFAKNTQAIGLDMESFALAKEANRAHVPFVIIRSVSDLGDEDLPLDFNLFLRPTGWLQGIGRVLINPLCLLGLGRLRRQSRIAGEALTAFFRSYAAAGMTDQDQRELSVS